MAASLSVLIIGGGIAGLTSAIALGRAGHSVRVLERDPAWSVYGVGIIQQGNVVRAMADLGVLEDYLASGFPFERTVMFAANGARIAEIPSPRLAGPHYPANLGISRPALHRLLGQKARDYGATIRLGQRATTLAEDPDGVAVTESDGTTGRYDVVIGADGIYSETRAMLFPEAPPPVATGQAVWRYNFPRAPDLDSLHAYLGPVGVGLVPLSDSLMYMYVVTNVAENPRLPREGLAAAMRAHLAGLAPRITALTGAIVDDAAVVYKPLEYLALHGPWYRGRAILIGDAAHATTPHLGQGAGMAIEDSLVLAEELSRDPDPARAFPAFMARREARCRFIVENSVAVGEYQMGRIPDLDYAATVRRMNEITAAPI